MSTDLRTIRCVIYRRVSTERQAGEVFSSLDDQRRACELLANHLDLDIGPVYTDDGFSGATIERRPAMQALLADCAAAPKRLDAPSYILVLNDSRWGRFPDPEESAYWRVHLARVGWIVRFAENDSSDDKTVRSLLRAIGASAATQKRDDVKANARRGMKGTVERGFWCSQAPFGYRRKVVYPPGRERVLDSGVRKAIDEKVVLAPHEEEAGVVRELFRRYATGEHSVQSLIDWASEVAPTHTWQHSSMYAVLTNPAHVGDIVFGRTPADRHERAARSTRARSEWYVHRDGHPAIVARALFDRVQEMLQQNRRRTRGVRSDWILSGIATCRCGAPLVSGGGGRRRKPTRDGKGAPSFEPSYRCSTHGNRARRCEYSGTVVKTAIESVVLREIMREASTPFAQQRILAHLDAALERARSTPGAELDALRRERAEIAQRRERLLSVIEDGTIKRDLARTRLDRLEAMDARVLAQIEAAADSASDEHQMRRDRDRIAEVLANLPALFKRLDGPQLRELVRPWIRRAVFNTDTRVLRLEIRHIPRFHMLSDPMGRLRAQEHEAVTVRRLVVPRRVAA
jgi:DNA invertase Pin-like site-specific DNA recombinase